MYPKYLREWSEDNFNSLVDSLHLAIVSSILKPEMALIHGSRCFGSSYARVDSDIDIIVVTPFPYPRNPIPSEWEGIELDWLFTTQLSKTNKYVFSHLPTYDILNRKWSMDSYTSIGRILSHRKTHKKILQQNFAEEGY